MDFTIGVIGAGLGKPEENCGFGASPECFGLASLDAAEFERVAGSVNVDSYLKCLKRGVLMDQPNENMTKLSKLIKQAKNKKRFTFQLFSVL